MITLGQQYCQRCGWHTEPKAGPLKGRRVCPDCKAETIAEMHYRESEQDAANALITAVQAAFTDSAVND